MPNFAELFIDYSNYLFYDYLGLSWYGALALAAFVYLVTAVADFALKKLKQSDNKLAKKLTKNLF